MNTFLQARRDSRIRRKLLEQRRNVLCGETTDDGAETRQEQVARTRRSKKYTRSKTDTSAAEMRAAMNNP